MIFPICKMRYLRFFHSKAKLNSLSRVTTSHNRIPRFYKKISVERLLQHVKYCRYLWNQRCDKKSIEIHEKNMAINNKRVNHYELFCNCLHVLKKIVTQLNYSAIECETTPRELISVWIHLIERYYSYLTRINKLK